MVVKFKKLGNSGKKEPRIPLLSKSLPKVTEQDNHNLEPNNTDNRKPMASAATTEAEPPIAKLNANNNACDKPSANNSAIKTNLSSGNNREKIPSLNLIAESKNKEIQFTSPALQSADLSISVNNAYDNGNAIMETSGCLSPKYGTVSKDVHKHDFQLDEPAKEQLISIGKVPTTSYKKENAAKELTVFKWFEESGTMNLNDIIDPNHSGLPSNSSSPVKIEQKQCIFPAPQEQQKVSSQYAPEKLFSCVSNPKGGNLLQTKTHVSTESSTVSADSFFAGIEEENVMDMFSTKTKYAGASDFVQEILKSCRLKNTNPRMLASTIDYKMVNINSSSHKNQVDCNNNGVLEKAQGASALREKAALDELEKTVDSSSIDSKEEHNNGKKFKYDQSFDIENVIDDSSLFDDFNVNNFRSANH